MGETSHDSLPKYRVREGETIERFRLRLDVRDGETEATWRARKLREDAERRANGDDEESDAEKARKAMVERKMNGWKKNRRDKQSAPDPTAASSTPGEDMTARNRAASQRGALERPTDSPEEEPNAADARAAMVRRKLGKDAIGPKKGRR